MTTTTTYAVRVTLTHDAVTGASRMVARGIGADGKRHTATVSYDYGVRDAWRLAAVVWASRHVGFLADVTPDESLTRNYDARTRGFAVTR